MVNATQSGDDARKTYIRTCNKCGREVEAKSRRGRILCIPCKPRCSVDGCDEVTRKYGMCVKHASRVKTNPRVSKLKVPLHLAEYTCIVCGSAYTPSAVNQKRCGRQSCARHQQRARGAKANQNRTKTLTCIVCGEGFDTINHGSKYCKNCIRIGISRGHNPEGSRLYEARVKRDRQAIIRELKRRSVVTDDNCWEWQGIVNKHGYGAASKIKGVSNELATHRIALEAKLGHEIGGMQAHHTCANRACCNPDHLALATNAENQGEMRARMTYEARIRELERIVRELAPDHPTLGLRAGKDVA